MVAAVIIAIASVRSMRMGTAPSNSKVRAWTWLRSTRMRRPARSAGAGRRPQGSGGGGRGRGPRGLGVGGEAVLEPAEDAEIGARLDRARERVAERAVHRRARGLRVREQERQVDEAEFGNPVGQIARGLVAERE